ncbi:MAG: efflux RND transporter periplasmic adaptor subunit [Candidatus Eremiobacteraeota bacterium]|nr:efflux RND transporter periplasmic adaptor subunit [Candidatus Eremiobacteraeota bacterium]
MTQRQQRTVFIVAIAVSLLALVAWRFVFSGVRSPQTSASVPAVPLATAREGVIEQTVTLSGRVGPAAGTQAKLAFSVPGTVRSVDVRLGERVTAGTPLARIDATTYSLAAQQAGADAQAASATAAVAAVDRVSIKLRVDRAELQRQQRLYQAGVVALRDVQAAQAALAADSADSEAARGQLVAAQAQSRSASAHAASAGYDLARTVLRAPTDGVISGIFVQAGDAVDTTAPAVALTPQIGQSATLDVPVSEVPAISTGDVVRARANGRSFQARVAGVAPAVNPATGLAVIDIRGVPADVPAGTPIDATVVVGATRGLIVPSAAIVEDPQNGNTLVFVRVRAADGTERFVPRVVALGVRNATAVRVVGGLREGERVAAEGGVDLLAPGGGQ